MKISILTLAYNHERFIRESLLSVVTQTRPADEIIVIDDASTDATAAVVECFMAENSGRPFRFIRNEKNLGLTGSLAKAIAAANGDIIVMMAGDDVSKSERIERCHEHFQSSPGSMALICNAEIIDEESCLRGSLDNCNGESGLKKVSLSGLRVGEHFLRGRGACGAAAAYRAQVFRNFRPIRHGIYAEDEPAAFRAMLLGTCDFLPERLVRWRRHSRNLSHGGGLAVGPEMAGHFRKCERMIDQMISDADERSALVSIDSVPCLENARQGLRFEKAKWSLWASAHEEGLNARKFFEAALRCYKFAPSFKRFVETVWRPCGKFMTPFTLQRLMKRMRSTK